MTREEILALPAGADLDRLVCERVLGVTRCPGPYCHCGRCNVSTDVRAAWGVVEAMKAAGWALDLRYGEFICAEFACSRGPCPLHGTDHHDWHGTGDVDGETMPLAVCYAALIAQLPESKLNPHLRELAEIRELIAQDAEKK